MVFNYERFWKYLQFSCALAKIWSCNTYYCVLVTFHHIIACSTLYVEVIKLQVHERAIIFRLADMNVT